MQVQLIDDLLDVSRIVTGKLNMVHEAVDLASVVTRAVEALSLVVDRKALKLVVELGDSEATSFVSGDATRLQQIVTNLLTNAIKFTPKLGTVTALLVAADGNAVRRRLPVLAGRPITRDFFPQKNTQLSWNVFGKNVFCAAPTLTPPSSCRL